MAGLPSGKMATAITEAILEDDSSDMTLMIHALTYGKCKTSPLDMFDYYSVADRESFVEGVVKNYKFIVVDFTVPDAVNKNAEFYCKHDIPFVMGTTGGDRERLYETVQSSNIPAVIAVNMSPQIVVFQAMMKFAEQFVGVLDDFDLSVIESHQQAKKDTSGTAKAVVGSLQKMGVEDFDLRDIVKIRNPRQQRTLLSVPDEHLGGHGYHQYNLMSCGGDVDLHFTHNVRGRNTYVDGTLRAIKFLHKKVQEGRNGVVYSMEDVLRG